MTKTEILKENKPKVGVATLIIKEGKVLLGKRKGKYGEGTWLPPGGHLEYKESIFDCAKRETLEEAGIKISNLRIGDFTNDNNLPYEKHYITLYVIAKHEDGEPTVMEPDKCSEWGWFEWNNLPQPLFYPMQNYVDEGFSPFI